MIYQKAINKWGERSQFTKLLEELGELSAAVAKYMNKDVENRHNEYVLLNNVIDEVADVEIMIEQLKRILSISVAVSSAKDYKLDRLKKLLDC